MFRHDPVSRQGRTPGKGGREGRPHFLELSLNKLPSRHIMIFGFVAQNVAREDQLRHSAC